MSWPAKSTVDLLLVVKEDEAYCQALRLAGVGYCARGACPDGSENAGSRRRGGAGAGVDEAAAGAGRRRRLGGGAPGCASRRLEAFQYRNDHYPDLDDTAVVVLAMWTAPPKAGIAPRNTRTPSRVGANGSKACSARAAGWSAFERRQFPLLSQQYPLRRSWRTARPADRGRFRLLVGMLAQLGDGGLPPGRRHRLSAPHPARRRKLVGRAGASIMSMAPGSALAGLAGARPWSGRHDDEEGRRLADRHSESRWRLGRENCDSYKLDYKGYASPRPPPRHKPPGPFWA